MIPLSTSVEALSRHYGVRVTYFAHGRPVVDVSVPCDTCHMEAAAERPGAIAAKMVRFRGDRVLFTALLDEDGTLLSLPHGSAQVIQRAFRAWRERGEPFLPMPPDVRTSTA